MPFVTLFKKIIQNNFTCFYPTSILHYRQDFLDTCRVPSSSYPKEYRFTANFNYDKSAAQKFAKKGIERSHSTQVLLMRPVLRCCFLASYVLLPALGNASVPVSNGPFDSFYHNPLEPHSIPILNLKAVSHAPNRLDILRLRCIKLNLLTDFLDMHRYRCDIPDGLHIPDLPE